MKVKNILALITISLLSTAASAKTISDYAGLMSALRNGETVHSVIDVDKCKYANGGSNLWEEKTRGFRIEDIYERVAPDIASGKKMRSIAASNHDYVGNKKEGMFVSRSLLRIFENGNVEVIDQSFTLNSTYGDESVLLCHLSTDGSGGVTLVAK